MKVFIEEQKYTQWYIWITHLFNLGMIGLFLYALYSQLILNTPFGDSPSPNWVLVVLIGVMIGISALIYSMKLSTRIDEKGIQYKFFPFHQSFRKIPWENINKVYTRKYNPITEYGGWVLRTGFLSKKGKAVNISGNIGIQLELKNNKKLLIGTHKEQDAKLILSTYKNKF
ncbi:hypothetical protein [Tenacibaculum sp. IB213877]|uniref:hypothetical protein n=1 Tax=Tenacibaculum sp. IB213877 TaxID=3097351 RepID=UPI002A5A5089|nr:hypothetical protein [Tenacibaculum sp. IB213877]MDY0781072.1 hypothetical protein [Tenacibaculum sp. IB213877]